MSFPSDPMNLSEDKSASTPSPTPSEAPKSVKGLLYEKIMRATHEYDEALIARRLAELAKIYPCLKH